MPLNKIKEFFEVAGAAVRRWANWVRINFLKYFTNRVKVVKLVDPKSGKELEATMERTEEKLCQHKHIEQVVGTFWRCMDCKEVWFEITYKVMLSRVDLIGFLETMATELGAKLADSDAEQQDR